MDSKYVLCPKCQNDTFRKISTVRFYKDEIGEISEWSAVISKGLKYKTQYFCTICGLEMDIDIKKYI